MNLFHNPSVDELHSLIQSAPESQPVHDVVVDYDGEVLIDPHFEQPGLDLNKFKFRIQLNAFSKRALAIGSAPLKYLYGNLLQAWDSETNYTKARLA